MNLSLDYETLGERQPDSTGVFEFWRTMITAALFAGNKFYTPGEAVRAFPSTGTLNCPNPVSCSTYGTTTHWNGNVMQQEAIKKIYDEFLEEPNGLDDLGCLSNQKNFRL